MFPQDPLTEAVVQRRSMLCFKQVAKLDQCVRPPFVIGFGSMRSAGLKGDREQLKFGSVRGL